MAQTVGEGFNRGRGAGRYGGGRRPKPAPKRRVNTSAGSANAAERRLGVQSKSYSRPNPPSYRNPAPRVSAPRSSAPRNYNTGGGGGGGGGWSSQRSGKSVGSNSSGRIAKTAAAPPAKPAPPPMTSEQWLAKGGDTVYKQQRDALAQALTDYTTRSTKEGTDYGITNAANRRSLTEEQGRSKEDLLNDFMARGAMGGIQQQAVTDFNTDWTKRLSDFDTAYTNWGNDAATALSDYKRNNALQLTKAQQDAIARRAASLG